jgi:hypothetical protein
MGRTRDVSKILTSNTSILSLASASTTYAPIEAGGLVKITPTSIANSGGSASISSTGTVSFTSASAISLNNCFTSTFNNYRVLFEGAITSGGANNLNLRFRAGGSDKTAAGYHGSAYRFPYTGGVSFLHQTTSGTTAPFGQVNVERSSYFFDVQGVNGSERAHFHGVGYHRDSSGPLIFSQAYLVNENQDGFTIYPSSVSMTGTIRVYGYRN